MKGTFFDYISKSFKTFSEDVTNKLEDKTEQNKLFLFIKFLHYNQKLTTESSH